MSALSDKLTQRLSTWVERIHAIYADIELSYAVAMIMPDGIRLMIAPGAWVGPGGDEKLVQTWSKKEAAAMMAMQYDMVKTLAGKATASAIWRAMRLIPVARDCPIETKYPLLEA